MAFFDSFSETVASAGKVFSHKTKEVAGNTKISIQISQEEAKLKRAYAALGQAYYADHLETMPEPYAIYAADVKESLARLEALAKDKQILNNQKHCTNCDALMPNEDRFCGKCGAENEIIVKEEQKEADVIVVEEPRTEENSKFCPRCHVRVSAELLYCPECGEKL